MNPLNFLSSSFHAIRTYGIRASKPVSDYDQDGLKTIHNHDFMQDPSFCQAYARGCQADSDYKWHWRVHIGLWAAVTASKIDGDFVECGVNRGFLSSAIMKRLNWDELNRTFYLLDTFSGIDPRYVSEEDRAAGALEKNKFHLEQGFYTQGVESVRVNFSEWKNVKIIQGSIPDTLSLVDTQKVAYLHLDMNCSPPEISSIRYFWNRLLPGAVVLLDDYAYYGFESQKHAMDIFAQEKNVMIASLPTGQGLLLKPPDT
ncbi:class I SAM-dependent methyltransferase [Lacunimicrobium album]